MFLVQFQNEAGYPLGDDTPEQCGLGRDQAVYGLRGHTGALGYTYHAGTRIPAGMKFLARSRDNQLAGLFIGPDLRSSSWPPGDFGIMDHGCFPNSIDIRIFVPIIENVNFPNLTARLSPCPRHARKEPVMSQHQAVFVIEKALPSSKAAPEIEMPLEDLVPVP